MCTYLPILPFLVSYIYSHSESHILSESWSGFLLQLWWTSNWLIRNAFLIALKQGFWDRGLPMATLIFSQTLMHVLDSWASSSIISKICSFLASWWPHFITAVLAQALLHWRNVYHMTSSEGVRAYLSWNGGSCFRLISQTSFVHPEWTSRRLIRHVLPEDLAWTTLVLFESWMSVLLDLSSTSRGFSWQTSLLILINARINSTTWSFTKVTIPLLMIFAHLVMLLVHLHDLHDWLLHFDLIASWKFGIVTLFGVLRELIRDSEGAFFRLTLLLLKFIVIECRDIVVHVLELQLVVLFLVSGGNLIHINVSSIQEGIWMLLKIYLMFFSPI